MMIISSILKTNQLISYQYCKEKIYIDTLHESERDGSVPTLRGLAVWLKNIF